jgi:hypothetical protein
MTAKRSFLDRLIMRENLEWAWKKAKRFYRLGDVWYDEVEVARFEGNIENELKRIAGEFRAQNYRLSPLRPVPQPKRGNKDGECALRQSFWVPVKDQVAWIAFVNVIGPYLDKVMPHWSYAYRLYRSAWYEDEDEEHPKDLRIGPYRHSSGYLYRKFHQTWPLFRREVFLTARAMAGISRSTIAPDLDEGDIRLLETYKYLRKEDRLSYLRDRYWTGRGKNLYWCSVDLEKFYPNLRTETIPTTVERYCPKTIASEAGQLATQLLEFPLDLVGWKKEELESIQLEPAQTSFHRVPTGLFAAGFLSNVAMLEVDCAVQEMLKHNRHIAHFRYVDDHIFLAKGFHDLESWVVQYHKLLIRHDLGVTFKMEKTEPKELSRYLSTLISSRGTSDLSKQEKLEAQKAAWVDPKYPSPLMNKTLTLVSNIARMNFGLLDSEEREHIFQDIEHLLLADLPDHELRRDTRVSFAAAKLATLGPLRTSNSERLYNIQVQIKDLKKAMLKLEGTLESEGSNNVTRKGILATLISHRKKLSRLEKDHEAETGERTKFDRLERKRIMSLLVKAAHEYPEKPRIWLRTLDFCFAAGVDTIKPLEGELLRIKSKNSVAYAYIWSLVTQATAQLIIKAARLLTERDVPSRNRLAASRFLFAVLGDREMFHPKRAATDYQKIARKTFEAALGTMQVILSTAPRTVVSASDLKRILKACKSENAVNWSEDSNKWSVTTNHSLSSWVWWAEQISTRALETAPSSIWMAMVGRLDPRDHMSWPLWARYPRHLPIKIANDILRKRNEFLTKYLTGRDEGWIFDLLTAKRNLPLARKSNDARVRRVLRSMAAPPEDISLYDWCETASTFFNVDPFDPRASEWTALEIVSQIARQISRPEYLALDSIPFHPANFLVPKTWIDHESNELTWESWRLTISPPRDTSGRARASGRGAVLRRAGLIWDSRFTPTPGFQPRSFDQLKNVRALGLLLLGLVCRTFNWPSVWNPREHQTVWSHIARSRLEQNICSTLTLQIIDACLSPRPRESFLLPSIQPELFEKGRVDIDTGKEPPSIYSIKDFLKWVDKAKKKLAESQITVQGHAPRQLLPVNVRSLKQADWMHLLEEETEE